MKKIVGNKYLIGDNEISLTARLGTLKFLTKLYLEQNGENMTMNIDEFEEKLKEINPFLAVISNEGKVKQIIYDRESIVPRLHYYVIFDIDGGWQYSTQNLLSDYEREQLQHLLVENGLFLNEDNLFNTADDDTAAEKMNNNSFVEYTNYLADTLQEKNLAYGDSFTKTMDNWGLEALGIRLSDKLSRIASLVKQGKLKENDESLEDTLLDLAGYAVLGLKYLKEHKDRLNTK